MRKKEIVERVGDDNFIFVENGKKPLKRVENTFGTEKIASYDQFLHFPQCFEKTSTAYT